jgi:hypothetical protein
VRAEKNPLSPVPQQFKLFKPFKLFKLFNRFCGIWCLPRDPRRHGDALRWRTAGTPALVPPLPPLPSPWAGDRVPGTLWVWRGVVAGRGCGKCAESRTRRPGNGISGNRLAAQKAGPG